MMGKHRPGNRGRHGLRPNAIGPEAEEKFYFEQRMSLKAAERRESKANILAPKKLWFQMTEEERKHAKPPTVKSREIRRPT
jgi:hypothetical protein